MSWIYTEWTAEVASGATLRWTSVVLHNGMLHLVYVDLDDTTGDAHVWIASGPANASPWVPTVGPTMVSTISCQPSQVGSGSLFANLSAHLLPNGTLFISAELTDGSSTGLAIGWINVSLDHTVNVNNASLWTDGVSSPQQRLQAVPIGNDVYQMNIVSGNLEITILDSSYYPAGIPTYTATGFGGTLGSASQVSTSGDITATSAVIIHSTAGVPDDAWECVSSEDFDACDSSPIGGGQFVGHGVTLQINPDHSSSSTAFDFGTQSPQPEPGGPDGRTFYAGSST